MPKTDENRTISREMIREHAEALFNKKGVEQTSVNDIVKKAGIAKGTFYLYFSNRDDLINSVFEKYLNEFIGDVGRKINENPLINYFSLSIIRYFDRNRLFLAELRRDLYGDRNLAYFRNTIDAFSNFILRYLNLKEEYPITQLQLYARMIIGMVLEISYRYSVDREIRDENEARVMLEDLLKRFFDCKQDRFIPNEKNIQD